MASKADIVECFALRVGDYHRMATISIGVGNVNAKVITIQPHTKFAQRDAITGALKKFDMLSNAYRATSRVVDFNLPSKQVDADHHVDILYPGLSQQAKRGGEPRTQQEISRYYLRELIQIVNPLMVITCGAEVTSFLLGRRSQVDTRAFAVTDIPGVTFYSVLNPADYGFAKGDPHLKEQGAREWTALAKVFEKLKEKQERERWI